MTKTYKNSRSWTNLTDLNGSDRRDGLWLWELTILAGGPWHGSLVRIPCKTLDKQKNSNVESPWTIFFFWSLGKTFLNHCWWLQTIPRKNSLEMFFFCVLWFFRGSVVFPEAMRCHVAQQQLPCRICWMHCQPCKVDLAIRQIRVYYPFDFFSPALGKSQVSYQNIVFKIQ